MIFFSFFWFCLIFLYEKTSFTRVFYNVCKCFFAKTIDRNWLNVTKTRTKFRTKLIILREKNPKNRCKFIFNIFGFFSNPILFEIMVSHLSWENEKFELFCPKIKKKEVMDNLNFFFLKKTWNVIPSRFWFFLNFVSFFRLKYGEKNQKHTSIDNWKSTWCDPYNFLNFYNFSTTL